MIGRRCGIDGSRGRRWKLAYLYPLAGFVLPTLVIGYGFVIPGTCVAGVNALGIGFAQTVLGACVTYVLGLRVVLRDIARRDDDETT